MSKRLLHLVLWIIFMSFFFHVGSQCLGDLDFLNLMQLNR